ncbi:MAG TPA: DedA family protein [Stellaceae bacterium]|nr:DedA family protein [Stellaceae bacterium]
MIDHYLQHYGSWAVAVAILLEDFGLPTPGESLLVAGAIAAAAGKLNVYALLGLAFAGAVIGDNIGYAIGRAGGHRLVARFGARVGITDERLKRVEAFFDRYGGWVIVFARFVVLLRQLNGIVAGTLEMHWLHFVLLNALGAALWVGFWGILAYTLGKSVHAYVHEFHALNYVLFAAAVVVIAGVGFLLWRRFTRTQS